MRALCSAVAVLGACTPCTDRDEARTAAVQFAGERAERCGRVGWIDDVAQDCALLAFLDGRPFAAWTGWTGSGDHRWSDAMGFDGAELRLFSQEAEWGCTDLAVTKCPSPSVAADDERTGTYGSETYGDAVPPILRGNDGRWVACGD